MTWIAVTPYTFNTSDMEVKEAILSLLKGKSDYIFLVFSALVDPLPHRSEVSLEISFLLPDKS